MNDYIEELKSFLSPLSAEEQFDVIEFYSEYLQDSKATTYQQAVAALGTPRQLARKILADYSIKASEQPEPELPRHNRPKQDAKLIWLIILAIFSTPITIPLAIGLFVAVLGLIFSVVAVVLGIGMTILICGITGVVVLLAGCVILAPAFWTGIYYIGAGLFTIGIFLMLLPVVKWLISNILHWTSIFFKWLYARITPDKTERHGDN